MGMAENPLPPYMAGNTTDYSDARRTLSPYHHIRSGQRNTQLAYSQATALLY